MTAWDALDASAGQPKQSFSQRMMRWIGSLAAQPQRDQRAGGSELATVLMSCRGAFVAVGLMSGTVNILALTGSFYMLQVYDRVIPSRSVPTLIGLSILAALLFLFQAILDLTRSRLLSRIGGSLDEELGPRVFGALTRLPLKTRGSGDSLQPIRDLDQVRGFLASPGPTALFDLPWLPVYLFICFIFHPWIGYLALAGALILTALALATEILGRGPSQRASRYGGERNRFAEACRRNAEVMHAMGLGGRLAARYGVVNDAYQHEQRRAGDVTGSLTGASKFLRMILQSAMLALGALLVINDKASGGIMIASSIMTARALAPVELAIAHWRGFLAARQSWKRLSDLLELLPPVRQAMPLPRPRRSLHVEGLAVAPPGDKKLVVELASFQLAAGSALGVIGPSASGKSSLARALVGIWMPARGTVRLDGATIDQWDPDVLGSDIGYLPQDVELFEGTIEENIGRFSSEKDADAVIAAAEAAGVHQAILQLSDGYETRIGERGVLLSAGQRQRIALARALYGDPFLVVLDEPNSNLDAEGEQALTAAIHMIRQRGGIAIVIAHRPSALTAVDLVAVMGQGRIQAFGPKEDVLRKALRPAPSAVVAG